MTRYLGGPPIALATESLPRAAPRALALASMIRSSTTGSWCLRPPSPNWHHVPFASEAKTGARSGATTATEGREPSRSSYEIEGPSEPSRGRLGSDGSSSCRIRRTARRRGVPTRAGAWRSMTASGRPGSGGSSSPANSISTMSSSGVSSR